MLYPDSSVEFPSYFVDYEYVDDEVQRFSGLDLPVNDGVLMSIGDKFTKSSFVDDLIYHNIIDKQEKRDHVHRIKTKHNK
jgi:hypothetical protein